MPQLVRKQISLSDDNVKKLEMLATEKGSSVAEIVRLAIDAYDPHGASGMQVPELMELVSAKLKEAIASTRKANRVVSKTLKNLDKGAA
ncbi:MAG: ribbon-helix-helix protein, CopG family [Gammaproteobacteria bacterium]|nr:ribbon-helix-helix protein, CopG family [Gammaproteobacteria bacterium]